MKYVIISKVVGIYSITFSFVWFDCRKFSRNKNENNETSGY
jgi:hypothetical protein